MKDGHEFYSEKPLAGQEVKRVRWSGKFIVVSWHKRTEILYIFLDLTSNNHIGLSYWQSRFANQRAFPLYKNTVFIVGKAQYKKVLFVDSRKLNAFLAIVS